MKLTQEYWDKLESQATSDANIIQDTAKLALSQNQQLEQVKAALVGGDVEGAKLILGCACSDDEDDKETKDKAEQSEKPKEVADKEDEVKQSEKEADKMKQSALDYADSLENEVKLSSLSTEAKLSIRKQITQIKTELL